MRNPRHCPPCSVLPGLVLALMTGGVMAPAERQSKSPWLDQSSAQIRGRCVDAVTGQPVAGGMVRIASLSPGTNRAGRSLRVAVLAAKPVTTAADTDPVEALRHE